MTVGIIVRNEAAHIAHTLAHVLASDFPADEFEVVVIDGHSTDGTAEIVGKVAEADPRVRLVVEPWQQGTHGLARNLAADCARGEYLAFTDGDCTVAPAWLAALVSRLASERTRDPFVVGAGGRRCPAPTKDWRERVIGAVMGTVLGSGGSQGFVPTRRRYTESIPNYNAIYLTDVVRRERYSALGVGDDYEFNTRLLDHGYKLAFEDAAVVYHRQPGGVLEFLRQAFRYGAAQAEVFRLRRRMRYFAPLAAMFVVGLVLGPFAAWLYPALGPIYLVGLAVYLALVMLSSLGNAGRLRDPRGLLSLALYPGLHVSYGLGVLTASLLRRPPRHSPGVTRARDVETAQG